MEAVSAQLDVLNKEVADLAADIKELYAEKKTAKEEDKAELQARIAKQEEEKKQLISQRNDLQQKLTAGGQKKRSREETDDQDSQAGSSRKITRSDQAGDTLIGVGSSSLIQPTDVQEMYESLLEAKPDEDGVYEISDKVRTALFPKMGTHRIIERNDYSVVREGLQRAMEHPASPAAQSVHIVGGTGAGKTCFLVKLLIEFIQNGKDVVVQPQIDVTVYFFSPRGCNQGVLAAFSSELNKPATLYLCDSSPPKTFAAFTILAATSLSQRIAQAKAPIATRLYLTDIGLDEMRKVRDAVRPEMSDEELQQKYERFGGSGRSCLDLEEHDAWQAVQTAIEKLSIAQMTSAVQNPASSTMACDNTLAYSQSGHVTPGRAFRSEEILSAMYDHLYKTAQASLLLFLRTASLEPDLQAFRGKLFERHVRAELGRVSTHKFKEMGSSDVQELKFDHRHHFSYTTYSSIQQATVPGENVVWTPKSKGSPSIDLLVEPNTVVQVTVSPDHAKLSMTKICNGWKALRGYDSASELMFYYAIPEDIFPTTSQIPLDGNHSGFFAERGIKWNILQF